MIYNHRVYSATSGGLKSEIRMPAGTVLSRVSGSGCHSLLLCSHGMFPVCASLPASPYKDPIILDERSRYLQLTESANTLLSNVVIFMCMLCAQSLQSCLTLCDPMDRSPPGSSVHGDSPARNTEVGCHALLQGIFPTQGSNPGLQHCRWILYHRSY